MADADVRWLQRLDNYGRALATLQRAITIANARPLSELEELGFPRFCGQSSGHHCGHYTGSSSPCFIDNGAEVFNR